MTHFKYTFIFPEVKYPFKEPSSRYGGTIGLWGMQPLNLDAAIETFTQLIWKILIHTGTQQPCYAWW